MKALGEHGFPVPVAIDSNRHAVLMTMMDAWPLVQVRELGNPGQVRGGAGGSAKHTSSGVHFHVSAAVQCASLRRTMCVSQVYITCMELISRLAAKGLVHCDFNEFNLLINDNEELTLIDFPQVSV